jgi:hypothetical protein
MHNLVQRISAQKAIFGRTPRQAASWKQRYLRVYDIYIQLTLTMIFPKFHGFDSPEVAFGINWETGVTENGPKSSPRGHVR